MRPTTPLEACARRRAQARRRQHPRGRRGRASPAGRASSCRRATTCPSSSAPCRAAGVYAPGGRAAYPSSVLMGCSRPEWPGWGGSCSSRRPAPTGSVAPAVLAAAHLAGVDEVYAIGGAQAVAALALGHRVDQAASTWSQGPATPGSPRPSASSTATSASTGSRDPPSSSSSPTPSANARAIALDALAQAEHGAGQPDRRHLRGRAVAGRGRGRARRAAPRAPSVADAPVALVEAPSLDHALASSDAFAPEHLELRFDGAEERRR